MPKLKSLIKSCDLFGEGIHLNIKGEPNLKTVIGGVSTLLTIAILSAATWVMGSDMIFKEQPFTDIHSIPFDIRPFYYLNRTNFPIAFCLQRYDQTVWNIDKYFKMEVLDWKAFNTNTSSVVKSYEFETCTYNHFPNFDRSYLETAGVSKYHCLKNQNISIGGYWDNEYIQYAIVRLRLCNNETDGGTCAPSHEIEEFFRTQIAFNIYVQDTIINPRSFDKPEQIYLLNLFRNVKLTSRKNFNVFVKHQELRSDEGFMFESNRNYSSYSFDTFDVDEGDASSDSVTDINLYVAPSKVIYYRSYTKIQNVLANFGGISDALFIIVNLLTCYFSKLHINQKLMNLIFDFDYKPINERRRGAIRGGLVQINNLPNSVDSNERHFNNNINDFSPDNSYRLKINKSSYASSVEFRDNYVKKPKEMDVISQDNKKAEIIMETLKKKNPNKKLRLTMIDMIFKPIFICTNHEGRRIKYALFNKASKTLETYMDISYIVQQIEEYQKLKVVLLDSEQLAMFQLIAKDICSLEEMGKLTSEISHLKGLVNNYEKMVQMLVDYKIKLDSGDRKMTPLDKKLFDLLDDDIKKLI
jgi:hypothetical protein